GQNLSARSVGTARLKSGQTLDTAEGYVEVLLTPGAFLRIGHNSEIRISSAGLVEAQVQLERGSALLEVYQFIPGTNLAVAMSAATTQIRKNGLYAFDAAREAVMVVDGQATVQEAGGATTLEKHHQVLLASDHPLKKRGFKVKALETDPLFAWSRARSEDVAQASSSAAGNATAYAAAPGWYWDPTWNFYGFWPYADSAYSAFGWNFYSPGYFGFAFYGGGSYYGGHSSWHGHSGWHWHGHGGGGTGSHGGSHSNGGGGHSSSGGHSSGGGHSGGGHSGGGHSGGGGGGHH